MPTVGRPDERGDLYATVELQIPTELSAEERKLYEELKTLDERRRVDASQT
jgi:DnaJ-class molecular chaperone